MTAARAWALGVWLVGIATAGLIVAQAHIITDLSAFLPAHPTPTQQLLVDQLRDGPASRLILIAIEDGDPAARAQVSAAMAQTLRRDVQFVSINNGETGRRPGGPRVSFQASVSVERVGGCGALRPARIARGD